MIINSPLNWQVHYDYARAGLGQDASSLSLDTGSTGPLPPAPVATPFTNISTGFTTGVSTMTSGWGIGEYAIVFIGGYMLLATFLTTRRGVRGARKVIRKRRARSVKRAREYYGL